MRNRALVNVNELRDIYEEHRGWACRDKHQQEPARVMSSAPGAKGREGDAPDERIVDIPAPAGGEPDKEYAKRGHHEEAH